MTSAPIRAAIVTEKIAYVRAMLEAIRRLPLATFDEFMADFRTAAAAESYLRRALESVFDLGRHILAKGFAAAPAVYKGIVVALVKHGVLDDAEGRILLPMAGYRNRLVHFYDEIGEEELYGICRHNLSDVVAICDAVLVWMKCHPDMIDMAL
jgi:uncharacterized protein YutE (UPF0331/DUF86 family)